MSIPRALARGMSILRFLREPTSEEVEKIRQKEELDRIVARGKRFAIVSYRFSKPEMFDTIHFAWVSSALEITPL